MMKKRILVIDDEPGFTKLLVMALPEYEICVENDATKALETALKFRPNLILLDVIMPAVDGGEVAALVRAEQSLSKVPIVFLTAVVTREEAAEGGLIGGFPFIAKPTTANKLRAVIEEKLK